MNLSVALRRAVAEQAKKYAHAEPIPHCFSYGDAPAVCFFPYESDLRHGNLLDGSYKAHRKPGMEKTFDEGPHSRQALSSCHRAYIQQHAEQR